MDKKETILIASDHNGNEHRDYLVQVLKSIGHSVVDLGPRTDLMHLSPRKVDYTDYAEQVGYAISLNQSLRGILICGTGIGMSIVANRFPGVKASLVDDVFTATKTREHNDSNVLVMGAWRNSFLEMEEMTLAWLNQEFGKERHEKRVAKLNKYDPESVVLVPGVFEIIHGGHIKLLQFAKSLGKVVVAINSDESGRKVKNRKLVNKLEDRVEILQRIDCVDEIIVMDSEIPKDLIKSTGAKYFVKGGLSNYEQQIRLIDGVPDDVEVKIFPIDHSHSTKKIIDSLKG